jgi:hypothetical protein
MRARLPPIASSGCAQIPQLSAPAVAVENAKVALLAAKTVILVLHALLSVRSMRLRRVHLLDAGA